MCIKIYSNKIFEVVAESEFRDHWLSDEKFLALRNKLITVHLSAAGNDESVLYYNRN